MKLSDVIKDYRESHGLSARELSKRSCVSHSVTVNDGFALVANENETITEEFAK